MKKLRYIFVYSLMMALTISCEKGLDPINSVNPGPDSEIPEITVTNPTEGSIMRVPEGQTTVTFVIVASDDIELASVVVQLDGTQIASYNSFKDYRRAALNVTYDGLSDGDHTLTVAATDKTDKSASTSVNFKKYTAVTYVPIEGEILYMAFEGAFTDAISGIEPNVTGTPTFGDGKLGQAYQGAADSYLTFPAATLTTTHEFSAAFWMKINATPDRAGILTMSPEDLENAGYPTVQNLRTSGFRFFREGSATAQTIKDNVGYATGECWNDGGQVDPSTGEWVHLAFTISDTKSSIYINGELARESDLTAPVDWTGCDILTIMSGVPRFTEWNHFSDLSLLDELHMFKRAITPEEIQTFATAR
ncbi:MAG: LamG domain-containing protein [Bacteroidales bacterium]|nr:LamG domain-containing protein [Bacteroidales bacterium]